MLGGVDSDAPFITANEQSESNPDYSFNSSTAYFASGRSYHQKLQIKQKTQLNNNWPASREKGYSDISHSVDQDQPLYDVENTYT